MDRFTQGRVDQYFLGLVDLLNSSWEEEKIADFLYIQNHLINVAIHAEILAGGEREYFINLVNRLYDLAEGKDEQKY